MPPAQLCAQRRQIDAQKFLAPFPVQLIADARQIGKARAQRKRPAVDVDAPGIDQREAEAPLAGLADQDIAAGKITEENAAAVHGQQVGCELAIGGFLINAGK